MRSDINQLLLIVVIWAVFDRLRLHCRKHSGTCQPRSLAFKLLTVLRNLTEAELSQKPGLGFF